MIIPIAFVQYDTMSLLVNVTNHSFINLAPELLSSFTKSPFEWTATLLFRVLKNSSIEQNSEE